MPSRASVSPLPLPRMPPSVPPQDFQLLDASPPSQSSVTGRLLFKPLSVPQAEELMTPLHSETRVASSDYTAAYAVKGVTYVHTCVPKEACGVLYRASLLSNLFIPSTQHSASIQVGK